MGLRIHYHRQFTQVNLYLLATKTNNATSAWISNRAFDLKKGWSLITAALGASRRRLNHFFCHYQQTP